MPDPPSSLPAGALARMLVLAAADAADIRHIALAGDNYGILVTGAQNDQSDHLPRRVERRRSVKIRNATNISV